LNCCTPLDELKFRKYWNTYYSTKFTKSFELFEEKYDNISKSIETFVK